MYLEAFLVCIVDDLKLVDLHEIFLFSIVPSKHTDIDPLSVCFYNVNMIPRFAGFFRPDHDPPVCAGMPRCLFSCPPWKTKNLLAQITSRFGSL